MGTAETLQQLLRDSDVEMSYDEMSNIMYAVESIASRTFEEGVTEGLKRAQQPSDIVKDLTERIHRQDNQYAEQAQSLERANDKIRRQKAVIKDQERTITDQGYQILGLQETIKNMAPQPPKLEDFKTKVEQFLDRILSPQ